MLKELDLHMTNRCNLSCKVCCFSSNELKLPELSTDQIIDVINQAKELGMEHIHLTGGEPLLREDLKIVLAYCKDLNIEVRLQTNGVLLSQKYAEELSELGLQSIMISIDSSDKEINDYIRGKGAYEKAMQAIAVALNLNWKVRVNAVLNKKTLFTFPGLVEKLSNLGVRCVSGFYFSAIGRGAKYPDLWILPEEYLNGYEQISKRILEKRKNKRIGDVDIIIEPAYMKWKETPNIDISEFSGCGGGCSQIFKTRTYIMIRCDGNVYPCVFGLDVPIVLGNVNQYALKDIIGDDSNWKQLNRSYIKSECGDCRHWNLCGGGCIGYAKLLKDKINIKDPRCEENVIIPLCPIMKYNYNNDCYGGASDDVEQH
ncbi:MAG: radical SAM protein [Pseudomonadota bacterium]